MTIAAAIFTCAMWTLVGYLLGYDKGVNKDEP